MLITFFTMSTRNFPTTSTSTALASVRPAWVKLTHNRHLLYQQHRPRDLGQKLCTLMHLFQGTLGLWTGFFWCARRKVVAHDDEGLLPRLVLFEYKIQKDGTMQCWSLWLVWASISSILVVNKCNWNRFVFIVKYCNIKWASASCELLSSWCDCLDSENGRNSGIAVWTTLDTRPKRNTVRSVASIYRTPCYCRE